jgi:hypothetical protein
VVYPYVNGPVAGDPFEPFLIGQYWELSEAQVPTQYWDCSFCSLINSADQDTCMVCGARALPSPGLPVSSGRL